jgi:hypothetical protein
MANESDSKSLDNESSSPGRHIIGANPGFEDNQILAIYRWDENTQSYTVISTWLEFQQIRHAHDDWQMIRIPWNQNSPE